MSEAKRRDPLARLFYLIAEPRVVRLCQLVVYLGFIYAGGIVLVAAPHGVGRVLGGGLLFLFGIFLALGGLLGAVAVLPGIWWLERAGIVALITALSIYLVVLLALGVNVMGVVVAVILIFCMVKRWLEIRRFQVAP